MTDALRKAKAAERGALLRLVLTCGVTSVKQQKAIDEYRRAVTKRVRLTERAKEGR